jgi:hypothetical protein
MNQIDKLIDKWFETHTCLSKENYLFLQEIYSLITGEIYNNKGEIYFPEKHKRRNEK